MNKIIYILLGPSGVGKTTLGNYLKSIGIPELVSHTTRSSRIGEADGVDYHFVDEKTFFKIEKVEMNKYGSNYYGVSKKETLNKLEKFNKVFAITELSGVKQFKNKYPGIVKVIFITTSQEESVKRMKLRGDSEDSIKERIKLANQKNEFNYNIYADYVLENHDLEKSKNELWNIVNK